MAVGVASDKSTAGNKPTAVHPRSEKAQHAPPLANNHCNSEALKHGYRVDEASVDPRSKGFKPESDLTKMGLNFILNNREYQDGGQESLHESEHGEETIPQALTRDEYFDDGIGLPFDEDDYVIDLPDDSDEEEIGTSLLEVDTTDVESARGEASSYRDSSTASAEIAGLGEHYDSRTRKQRLESKQIDDKSVAHIFSGHRSSSGPSEEADSFGEYDHEGQSESHHDESSLDLKHLLQVDLKDSMLYLIGMDKVRAERVLLSFDTNAQWKEARKLKVPPNFGVTSASAQQLKLLQYRYQTVKGATLRYEQSAESVGLSNEEVQRWLRGRYVNDIATPNGRLNH